MKPIVILPSFERCVKKLNRRTKEQVAAALEKFNDFLVSGRLPAGLGFKKINHDKYEFRIDLRLRVILKEDKDNFYLVLAGDHEDVKRYLRNFR